MMFKQKCIVAFDYWKSYSRINKSQFMESFHMFIILKTCFRLPICFTKLSSTHKILLFYSQTSPLHTGTIVHKVHLKIVSLHVVLTCFYSSNTILGYILNLQQQESKQKNWRVISHIFSMQSHLCFVFKTKTAFAFRHHNTRLIYLCFCLPNSYLS